MRRSTPLTRKIAEFSRLLLYFILGLAGLAFLVGVVRGESASDMFMAAVALGLVVFAAIEFKKWLDARQRKDPDHPPTKAQPHTLATL